MKRRNGTTLTEILIAGVLAILLIGLVVGFLAGTRRQEERTTRRLDDLTVAARIGRALERDLQAAYVDARRQPRAAAGTLSFAFVKGPGPHALAEPLTAQVAYTFDAASGAVARHEGGRMQVLGRLQGGKVAFESTITTDGAAQIVVRIEPGKSELVRAGARPLIVSRAVYPPALGAGALPWVGPGVQAPPAPKPAGTPAD